MVAKGLTRYLGVIYCQAAFLYIFVSMELHALKHDLQRFDDNSVEIPFLTTERHKDIRCFLRKNQKYIRHQFDV